MTRLLTEIYKDFPDIEDITPIQVPGLVQADVIRDLITPEMAGQVLWVAGDEEAQGVQPGEFFHLIIKAAFRGDPTNFVKLSLVFPGHCWAAKIYTTAPDGADFLRRRFKEWKVAS